jgi:hypothetical protein
MKNGPYEMLIAPKNYPGKKYRGRYAYEHHIVWWEKHGRLPRPGHEIHHKDMNHRNNKLSNLEEMTKHAHQLLHGALLKAVPMTIVCANCKKNTNFREGSGRVKEVRVKNSFSVVLVVGLCYNIKWAGS